MKTEVTNLFNARRSKKLMRVLFSLTLRGDSEMRNRMHMICGDYAKDYPVILVRINKKVVGWALIQPCGGLYYADFYVARAFRRRGIGTILYNTAKELCSKKNRIVYCSPWDEVSAAFFIKLKAKIDGELWQDTISSDLTDIFFD